MAPARLHYSIQGRAHTAFIRKWKPNEYPLACRAARAGFNAYPLNLKQNVCQRIHLGDSIANRGALLIIRNRPLITPCVQTISSHHIKSVQPISDRLHIQGVQPISDRLHVARVQPISGWMHVKCVQLISGPLLTPSVQPISNHAYKKCPANQRPVTYTRCSANQRPVTCTKSAANQRPDTHKTRSANQRSGT